MIRGLFIAALAALLLCVSCGSQVKSIRIYEDGVKCECFELGQGVDDGPIYQECRACYHPEE